jgi:tetratricopeptide (TPR) repeat protein
LAASFLLTVTALFSQNRKIDSLINVSRTAKQDSDRVTALVQLCYELRIIGETQKALDYGNNALVLAQKIKWKRGEARSFSNIGVVYLNQGSYPKALDYFLKGLKIAESIKDPKVLASIHGNMGNVYLRQADYPRALENYFSAYSMAMQANNKSRAANQLGNIGIVYYQEGQLAQGVQRDSLFMKALDFYNRALKLDEEVNYENGICADLGNIGIVYDELGQMDKAIVFFRRAQKLAEKTGNLQFEANNLASMGTVYTRQKKYPEAERILLKALDINRKQGALEGVKNEYQELSQLYELMGSHRLAFENFKKYIGVRDTLVNEENTKKQTQAEMQYVFSKKQAADSIRNEEQMKQEALKHEQEIAQQQVYTYGGLIGFALMLVVAGISFRAYRNKQKANEIISQQKLLVEEKQKEVLDSIHYAKRIQRSLLPSEKYIGRVLARANKK